MKPFPVTFYLYAEDEGQIKRLERLLYTFVNTQYQQGVAVTANRLSDMVEKFSGSPIFQQFLKK